jgi:hypothetical protein
LLDVTIGAGIDDGLAYACFGVIGVMLAVYLFFVTRGGRTPGSEAQYAFAQWAQDRGFVAEPVLVGSPVDHEKTIGALTVHARYARAGALRHVPRVAIRVRGGADHAAVVSLGLAAHTDEREMARGLKPAPLPLAAARLTILTASGTLPAWLDATRAEALSALRITSLDVRERDVALHFDGPAQSTETLDRALALALEIAGAPD